MSITKKLVKNNYKVKFELPKELVPTDATDVRVLGSFNDWDWKKGVSLEMKKNAFVAEISLPAGKVFEYRYLVDNYFWTNDNQADGYKHCEYAGTENSVLVLPIETKKTPAKKATTAKTANKKVTATAAPKAEVKPVAKKATVKKVTAKKATTKTFDFTVIEGVGPKINQLLMDGGFKTFDALANANVNDIQAILDKAGSRYKMHDPKTWAQQSKLASQNKWDELKTLQAKLNGGKAK